MTMRDDYGNDGNQDNAWDVNEDDHDNWDNVWRLMLYLHLGFCEPQSRETESYSYRNLLVIQLLYHNPGFQCIRRSPSQDEVPMFF